MARMFTLVRDEDVTGVSGTGVVAEGIEFSGGVVALRWLSDWPTSVVFHERGMESVEAVHGHGGKTRIVWQADEIDRLRAMLHVEHDSILRLNAEIRALTEQEDQ